MHGQKSNGFAIAPNFFCTRTALNPCCSSRESLVAGQSINRKVVRKLFLARHVSDESQRSPTGKKHLTCIAERARGTCSQNKRFVQPAIDHCESVLFKSKDAACEAEYHALVPETLISRG